MPIIHVNLLEGRSADAKRKFALQVTQSACECLDVAPEQVRIIFNDMPR
ncbi:MAG: tautomerase family protein, partial [Synergistaceae bacterium]|nr:tautomerase family protein [Synergistaceae bacterium]